MGIAFKAPIYPGYTIYGEYSPAFSSPNTASPLTSPTSSHQYSPLNGNGLNFLSWSPQSNGMADGGRRFYGLKSVSPSPNTYYGPGYNGLLDFLELEGKAGDHKYDGCSVIESDLWAPPKLA
ncbi:hypothetical protein GGI20_003031 [Coemansia sp. BCRC 34301]|nr:hypothetical protein GGI20_003031 [Coemansia sp. BCRC 34301]